MRFLRVAMFRYKEAFRLYDIEGAVRRAYWDHPTTHTTCPWQLIWKHLDTGWFLPPAP